MKVSVKSVLKEVATAAQIFLQKKRCRALEADSEDVAFVVNRSSAEDSFPVVAELGTCSGASTGVKRPHCLNDAQEGLQWCQTKAKERLHMQAQERTCLCLLWHTQLH